jgi:hypothetical protein
MTVEVHFKVDHDVLKQHTSMNGESLQRVINLVLERRGKPSKQNTRTDWFGKLSTRWSRFMEYKRM